MYIAAAAPFIEGDDRQRFIEGAMHIGDPDYNPEPTDSDPDKPVQWRKATPEPAEGSYERFLAAFGQQGGLLS